MPDNVCDAQTLKILCLRHGFELPEAVVTKLALYLGLLVKWNRAMNLVGQTNWREILDDLVLDSFHLAEFLAALPLPPNPECWDFGAGAGIPGIPLRMVWPEGNYILVEARKKRALFMRNVLAVCGMASKSTKVYHGRAERFLAQAHDGLSQAGKADLLLSRAFMPWRDFLDLIWGNISNRGLAVCLTLEAAPKNCPGGRASSESHSMWELVADRLYSPSALHPEKKRHFWAFRRRTDIDLSSRGTPQNSDRCDSYT
jgi:16S rRNA (guanine527-N7)-methyltransferase